MTFEPTLKPLGPTKATPEPTLESAPQFPPKSATNGG